MSYKKVIIIGAPRSGTNMLRDILCSFDCISTWPCDEINYIWRYGNHHHISDEFTVDMATPKIASYIQRKFDWVAQKHNAQIVVEKTCANSLRVPFVDKIIPDSKYIFIYRDGLDVVGSSMDRWQAPLDLVYLAKKARFVPISNLPYYAYRYLLNRLYRIFSFKNRLAFWGPQLHNMVELLANHSLDEVCAIQWQACVDKAATAFDIMPNDRWIALSYENFTSNPEAALLDILDFIGISARAEQIRNAVANVSVASVGKGRSALSAESVHRLERITHTTLLRLGYI